jgi:hypothetical protein
MNSPTEWSALITRSWRVALIIAGFSLRQPNIQTLSIFGTVLIVLRRFHPTFMAKENAIQGTGKVKSDRPKKHATMISELIKQMISKGCMTQNGLIVNGK